MPPQIAAIGCGVFILWLFYRDKKSFAGSSAGVWIATIWVSIIASKPIGAWIGNSYDIFGGGAEGSPADRYVFLGLTIAAFTILTRRKINWSNYFRQNIWIVIFQLAMFASILWSDDPFVSFKRWFRGVGNILIVLTLLTEREPAHAIRLVFIRTAFLLIPLSVLVNKYYQQIGVYYNPWTGVAAYSGVTTDKNGLGRLVWISGLFLVWSISTYSTGRWFKALLSRSHELAVFGLCIALLLQSKSATSLAVFIVVITVYWMSGFRLLSRNPRMLAVASIVFVAVSFTTLVNPTLRTIVTTSLGRNPNLTDRVELWQSMMDLDINPVFGTGFASFWLTPEGMEIARQYEVNEAHNGFIEIYLNTGFVGILLMIAVLLRAGRNTLDALITKSKLGRLYAAVLFGGLIYNYTETAINDTSLVGFLIWLVASTYREASSLHLSSGVAPRFPGRAVAAAPSPC